MLNVKLDLQKHPIIFDYIKNGITITNQHSIIIYTNPAFTTITGYTSEDVMGKSTGMLHSGRHDDTFYKSMWKNINEKGFWEGEIWNRKKSGTIFPEYLTISRIEQDDVNDFLYIAVFSDISFLKEDISKKLHLAFYDPLTELPNRNLYMDRVNKIIEDAKTSVNKKVVVFFMDLDKFKQVNDTHGHCVGDKLLKMVGQRMASITRESDTVARIGGDEFAAIITSNCDKEAVIAFAQRIVEHLERPFQIDEHEVNISISIGISFYPNDASDLDVLLKNADQAMYIAKKDKTKIRCHGDAR